uniref:Aminopeptidase n=1 Tax=Romanomermis culicivorax TaxID=13658 RepID=A0A915L5H9_ROMCU
MAENFSSRELHRKVSKIFFYFCLTVTLIVFLFVGLYFLFAFPSSPSSLKRCPIFRLTTNTSNDWLLPDTVYPVHYNLTIKIHLQPFLLIPDFHGREWISFIVNQKTKFIILHAKDLSLKKEDISVTRMNTTNKLESQVNVSDVIIHKETQRLIIQLEECLEVVDGYSYKIYFDHFDGKIQNDGKGLYLSRYIDAQNRTVFLSATQFEVSEARKMFPCFDEPRFKANFTISVIRHKNMISLSNMHQIESEEREDNYVQDYYATSVAMSTYLVAVVVCNFPYKENVSKSGIKIRAFARSDLLNDVDYALKTAQLMLDHYEEYFQYNYPLLKLDMIALPDFVHGAMENWGLVTFRESTMLYNSEVGTVLSKETVTMIVGHELAHQWFGNLVTMRWWNDLWLNEGFAHYMGYVVAEAVYPQETMDYSFLVSNPLEALKLDSMESTHAILMDVHHPNEIIQLFDIITYKKGACLVKMLHKNFGPETFRDGLRMYFKRYAYKNTVSKNLWQSIEIRQNLTITSVMDNWITKTGYPVITLTRNYVTNKIFTPPQRAQILSDSFELAVAGTLDITLAFNLSKYLINETEYLPWMTATKNFLFVDTFMQTVPEYNLFLSFMQKLLSKVYATFGWTKIKDEPKYTSYLRFLALEQSCHYKNPDCLNKTAQYLQQWTVQGSILNLNEVSGETSIIFTKCSQPENLTE